VREANDPVMAFCHRLVIYGTFVRSSE
jgi:hypothetical protein